MPKSKTQRRKYLDGKIARKKLQNAINALEAAKNAIPGGPVLLCDTQITRTNLWTIEPRCLSGPKKGK